MRRNLLILRIVETVLLLVVVGTGRQVETLPTGEVVYTSISFNILFSAEAKFWFNPSANHFVISSIALGYLVSVIGTVLQRGKPNRTVCLFSLVLAVPGLLSVGNEFIPSPKENRWIQNDEVGDMVS